MTLKLGLIEAAGAPEASLSMKDAAELDSIRLFGEIVRPALADQ